MNEIIKTNSPQIIRSFDDAERAARAMSASGFFQDSKSAAQAVVKILAGQELGFGPFASMTGVAVIQGKPAIGANLMAAAVKRAGKYNYRVIEMSNDACEIAFFEGGQEIGRSRFDKNDATAAGLWNKDNWKKFPRNMLFARALSNGVRWYTPDIFNGATVYTPDEMGAAVDDDGNPAAVTGEIVTGEVTHEQPARPQANEDAQKAKGLEMYEAMRQRAAAVGIDAEPATSSWSLPELRGAYADLKRYVEDAERQAADEPQA